MAGSMAACMQAGMVIEKDLKSPPFGSSGNKKSVPLGLVRASETSSPLPATRPHVLISSNALLSTKLAEVESGKGTTRTLISSVCLPGIGSAGLSP